MWFVILVLIIDALVWGYAAIAGPRGVVLVVIGDGTKVTQFVLCILNVIATVILFMR